MQLTIKATHTTLTESLRDYTKRKLVLPLEKLINRSAVTPLLNIEIELVTRHHKQGRIFRAEANLVLGKKILRAEADGENLYEAIDLLEYELMREARHFKEKGITKARRGAYLLKTRLRKS